MLKKLQPNKIVYHRWKFQRLQAANIVGTYICVYVRTCFEKGLDRRQ